MDMVTWLELHCYDADMSEHSNRVYTHREETPLHTADPLLFAVELLEGVIMNTRTPPPAYVEVQRYVGGGEREIIALYEVTRDRGGYLCHTKPNEVKGLGGGIVDIWILNG